MMQRLRGPAGEALLAVLIFASAVWWGTTYWRLSLKAGREPQFYQLYFEPAVMIACHHGFVISHPQPKPLEDFLWRRTNTFSCDQVATGANLSQQSLYQGAWRYMMYAVGLTWRATGISWTRLGPLFGILFGFTIVASYGIFRLGMNRWLAAAGAFALSVSTLHLTNLPHLRDYSKAPFTLASVLILGLLVMLPVRRLTVILLSIAYGLALGIGYGFRTDLLINIPPILVVLFLFLDGGLRKHLTTKVLGCVAFIGAFVLTAWPILGFVNEKGGGQWHVALLGLSTPFDEVLRIEPAPYTLAQFYSDGYVGKTSLAYAARVRPEWRDAIMFTHEYDLATGAYFREIVTRFPGDMVTRAYASTLVLTELPFGWPAGPIDGLARWVYRPRAVLLSAAKSAGPFLIAAAVIAASAYSMRVGFFLLFFLLYFGGYPALQFGTRHYFHLEFMTWWAGGFLVSHMIRRPPVSAFSLRRLAIFAGVSAIIVLVPWGVLRLYQEGQARRVLKEVTEASKKPIPFPARDSSNLLAVKGPAGFADVWMMEVDVNRSACGAAPSITFQYDQKQPDYNFSSTVAVPATPGAREATRIFTPIYSPAFQGLVLSPDAARCVGGAYWVDSDHHPLLLAATLGPGWESQKLYQRLSIEPGAKTP